MGLFLRWLTHSCDLQFSTVFRRKRKESTCVCRLYTGGNFVAVCVGRAYTPIVHPRHSIMAGWSFRANIRHYWYKLRLIYHDVFRNRKTLPHCPPHYQPVIGMPGINRASVLYRSSPLYMEEQPCIWRRPSSDFELYLRGV